MAKPIIKITKENNKAITLTAKGELNTQHANELKSNYLQLVKEQGDVHIALNDVTAFDVAAVQLTYLLKKEINKMGRKITITLPQQKTFKALLEKSSVHKML